MKRWWGIRHVRWWFLSRELHAWWRRYGRYHWLCINEADLRYLDRVWRGKA